MNNSLHHVNIRRRIHAHHEPFPAPRGAKRVMDKLIYVVGILAPFASLPQLLKILHTHSGAGISPFTWSAFTANSAFWLYYGLLHKDRPTIIAHGLWLVFNAAILLSALVYH